MTDADQPSSAAPDDANLLREVPQANIQSVRPGMLAMVAGSYMWLLTLVCLLVAIGLVWWSLPQRGIEITIRFPEGHGLEAEDIVRFRGIEVGTVEQVQLNPQLSGVDVTVNLKPFAEPLAREGTRFWIVRPELSLNEISGLETAVGHKYIGVLPGDPAGNWQTIFDGMPQAPPDLSGQDGTEIILRGERRFGINPGSPLLFRGVVVGRVLSVNLSNDRRFVESRVRVFSPHENLITDQTRFWASSGVDLDLKWGSGLKVDVESIETIVKGGVSMLTLQPGGESIRPGQMFPIVATAEADWYTQAAEIAVTESENLRAAIPLTTRWRQKGIFGTSDKQQTLVGTHLFANQISYVLAPTDMLIPPGKSIEGSFKLTLSDSQQPIATLGNVADFDRDQPTQLLRVDQPDVLPDDSRPFLPDQLRVPVEPEACLAVRRENVSQEGVFFHLPFTKNEIGDDWQIKNFDGDRDVWHGAPILAESDGSLIGTLRVVERQASIVPVDETLLQQLPEHP